jgi:hypothetical protein
VSRVELAADEGAKAECHHDYDYQDDRQWVTEDAQPTLIWPGLTRRILRLRMMQSMHAINSSG